MSNQSISSSEFQRFQDQLISLKEAKYKSEEKCELLIRNLSQLESKCAHFERELAKANDLKNKFRSAKDMDMLMNENQILRDRLSTIEGNFKLQNDVIRVECENLFSENERLKSQMETYKSTQNKSDPKSSHINDDDDVTDSSVDQDYQYKIRYLQHEVTKLLEEKTEIASTNTVLQTELVVHKQSEDELVARINCLLNEKSKLTLQLQSVKQELELSNANHASQFTEATAQFDKQTELQQRQHEEKSLQLKTELEAEYCQRHESSCTDFRAIIDQSQLEYGEKEIEFNRIIAEMTIDNDRLRREKADEIRELTIDVARRLTEKESQMSDAEERYRAEIGELETANRGLRDSLEYTREELKVSTRKNQNVLKDVRKQLEKEVKLTQETQSKLEEVVSSGSQNSQSKINDYLVGVNQQRAISNGDDQSSIYSSSNNGALGFDALPVAGNSIAMTDDELKVRTIRAFLLYHISF